MDDNQCGGYGGDCGRFNMCATNGQWPGFACMEGSACIRINVSKAPSWLAITEECWCVGVMLLEQQPGLHAWHIINVVPCQILCQDLACSGSHGWHWAQLHSSSSH